MQAGLSLLVSSPLPPNATVWEVLGSLEFSAGLGVEGRTLVGDTLYSWNPCPTHSAGTSLRVASENNSIASWTLQCVHIIHTNWMHVGTQHIVRVQAALGDQSCRLEVSSPAGDLGKSWDLFVPPFPHLKNGDN